MTLSLYFWRLQVRYLDDIYMIEDYWLRNMNKQLRWLRGITIRENHVAWSHITILDHKRLTISDQ